MPYSWEEINCDSAKLVICAFISLAAAKDIKMVNKNSWLPKTNNLFFQNLCPTGPCTRETISPTRGKTKAFENFCFATAMHPGHQNHQRILNHFSSHAPGPSKPSTDFDQFFTAMPPGDHNHQRILIDFQTFFDSFVTRAITAINGF